MPTYTHIGGVPKTASPSIGIGGTVMVVAVDDGSQMVGMGLMGYGCRCGCTAEM